MARTIFENAVVCDDVILACGKKINEKKKEIRKFDITHYNHKNKEQ